MKKLLLIAAIAAFVACDKDDDNTTKTAGPEQPLSETFERIRIEGSEQLTDMSFYNENNGVIVGALGRILITKDGGNTWTYPEGPTNMSYSSVLMLNPQNVFAGRVAFYKLNAQNEIDTVGELGNYQGSIKSIYFKTPQKGYIMKGSDVLKTTDGGESWTIAFGENPYLKNMVFASPNVAYAYGGTTHDGASGAVLFKSIDGGDTWTDLQKTGPEVLAAQFINETTGFVADYEGKIYKTTNGGTAWTEVGALPDSEHGCSVSALMYVSDKQFLASAYNGKVYKSVNGGKDWTVLYEHPDGNAISKIYRVGKTLYIIGDDGLVLKN